MIFIVSQILSDMKGELNKNLNLRKSAKDIDFQNEFMSILNNLLKTVDVFPIIKDIWTRIVCTD